MGETVVASSAPAVTQGPSGEHIISLPLREAREMFERPAHPYTEALLKSVPDVSKPVDRLPSI